MVSIILKLIILPQQIGFFFRWPSWLAFSDGVNLNYQLAR